MSKNIIGSIFFLALSSFYFYNVFDIKELPNAQFEVMTPSTFPFYIGIIGIIISLLMLFFAIKEKHNEKISLEYLKSLDFKTIFLFITLMFLYGLIIKILGFILSTIIFLALSFIFLKERNIKRILIISISISVGFYLILNNILGVYIVPGFFIEYIKGVFL
ncbi:tripartite tricarboxylate transporter TctB family protein [Malaciobacter mytili]|uniref:Tricarboxylate transporter n=1 Tax=Malaciobacter mytili LMG 24559 TaxID=1032238 RepID=A0AAX2AH95_9BACT|nr:tripartite tricarboxylate transporter TctB family protein [Malaciobacter mytili]AXH13801.1 tripartite tricarboxylate transport protein TctABC, membrane-spanning subunit TctB [Malaciobacter mytili LMG 24559]RXK15544.1 tricarboxylate transporter [Malaciobacter mytili LMG 24559]